MRSIRLIFILMVLTGCASTERSPASISQPRNPVAWNSWLRTNFPDWYFESSRIEADPRPWPKPFDPVKDPVFAHNEIYIPNITPRQALRAMADSRFWPDFYPNSGQPQIRGSDGNTEVIDSLRLGLAYEWTTFGVRQRMRVTEYVDGPVESVLAWSGGSLGTAVYHRWLMKAKRGGTEVITEECERGAAPFLDRAIMARALHATHQLWLENLKRYLGNEPLGDLLSARATRNKSDEDPELFGLNLSWFNVDYTKSVESRLAEGVWASLGGGGNSLVISGGSTAVLVDTKFGTTVGPNAGAAHLHDWIRKNLVHPITAIVNTHYHYDHTFGNALYGPVKVYAHPNVSGLMLAQDEAWWKTHGEGFPNQHLTAPTTTLKAGNRRIELNLSLPAHTSGDLWLYLPEDDIVVLGDLMFHEYYPFFDEHRGGSSITGTITMLRTIARAHPAARYLPGHGPICSAKDVLEYADYLESMYRDIKLAITNGLTPEAAADAFDQVRWKRKVLPSLHDGRLRWATARTAFISAFRVIAANHE